MNLYFRFFVLILRTFWRFLRKATPASIRSEVRTSMHVWPNDLDFNFHMNNGRYLTVMDLGRFDWLAKTGTFGLSLRRRWFPILGGAHIVFLRPLKLGQQFEVRTTLETWDEKWFIMRQTFESSGKTCAVATVRGLLRGPLGNVPPVEILRAAGETRLEPPVASESTRAWLESQRMPF